MGKKHKNTKDGRRPGNVYVNLITCEDGTVVVKLGSTTDMESRNSNYKSKHGKKSIVKTYLCRKFRRNYQYLEHETGCKFGNRLPQVLFKKGKFRKVEEYWPLSELDKIVEAVNAIPN